MNQIDHRFVGPIQDQLMTRKELEAVLKVHSRTIDRLVASGKFPAPVHIGKCCRWLVSTVEQFIHCQGKEKQEGKE